VTTIAFDKTGTITEGTPGVTDVRVHGGTEEDLLRLAASVETGSEHPIGQAIIREARARVIKPSPVSDFAAVVGEGVQGRVGMDNANRLRRVNLRSNQSNTGQQQGLDLPQTINV